MLTISSRFWTIRLKRRSPPLARLWIHGHLHCQQDYVEGACRVVANTLGYARKGEQEGFRPDWLVEVPAAAAA